VVDILDGWVDGEPILVTYLNDPDLKRLGYNEYAVTFDDPSELNLTPAASFTQPVEVEFLAAVAPSQTSSEAPDVLWMRHGEALRLGALSRVLATPGVAWENQAAADRYDNRYDELVAEAEQQAGRNRVNNARILRVRAV